MGSFLARCSTLDRCVSRSPFRACTDEQFPDLHVDRESNRPLLSARQARLPHHLTSRPPLFRRSSPHGSLDLPTIRSVQYHRSRERQPYARSRQESRSRMGVRRRRESRNGCTASCHTRQSRGENYVGTMERRSLRSRYVLFPPPVSLTHSSLLAVICISPVSSTEEAIAVANDSDYSLIASLWTTSLSSLPIAQRIRAGSVQINGTTIHIEPAFGNAGLGGKSGYGRFNLDSFTDMRSIGIHMPGKKFPLVQ